MLSSSLQAEDYRRMAESLLRDAQKQISNHDREIQNIVDGTREAQQKSFFGFDVESTQEVVMDQKVQSSDKTCHASKMKPSNEAQAKYQGDSELMVFVSLGMADETLKSLSQQAKALGGVLVIRGLVENSFQKTHQRLKSLGIPIDIDPTLFERFEVTRVPSIVLAGVKDGKLTGSFDRVRGNVSIRSALELFATEGDLFPTAQVILKKKEMPS